MRVAKFPFAIVPLLLFLALASSCIVDETQSLDFRQLDRSRWLKRDTLTFEVFIPSGGEECDFALWVRLNHEYDYLRLPFSYRIENDFGFSLSDSSSVIVADNPGDFSGFLSGYRQYEAPFAPALPLPIAGLYRIHIAPRIEVPLLRGVENVGLAARPHRRDSK